MWGTKDRQRRIEAKICLMLTLSGSDGLLTTPISTAEFLRSWSGVSTLRLQDTVSQVLR